MRIMKRILWIFPLLLILVLAVACSPEVPIATLQPTKLIELIPFHTQTATPTITPTPEGLPTATPKPTITPTPRVYEIHANDTLLSIAYYYGITLEELQAANPEVNPALLAIGSKLIIPPGRAPTATTVAPTPTPWGVTTGEMNCFSGRSGGLHCFVPVSNDRNKPAQYLSASISLVNDAEEILLTKVVPLALKILKPGDRVPFHVYFSPPMPAYTSVIFNLLTSVKASADNVSTFPLEIDVIDTSISPDGSSAMINGTAKPGTENQVLSMMTLVAVAYDGEGKVIGMRRVEQSVDPNTMKDFPFSIRVYSESGEIVRVEVFGEAE